MALPTLPALTDDLLAEIFLRRPVPADLVRASVACVSYRRLVTERSFLRRFRSLHAPPLLGFFDNKGFHPALPNHPSASAARAVSLAADFSFSFLPSPGSWIVRDSRDGRVLLDRAPEGGRGEGEVNPVFTELAVCDPLHRRCLLLPPIPDDLAASVEQPHRMEFDRWCEPFLAPLSGEEEEEAAAVEADETSFRVIWMAQCKAKLVAFVFSSCTGQWRAAASQRWGDLVESMGTSSGRPVFFGRQYAYGRFYWLMDWRDKMLVLYTQRMEFSIADFPPGCHMRRFAMVEAGEGRPGVFVICDHLADGPIHLRYMIKQDGGEGSNQWKTEKEIPLDRGYQYYIRGATERHLLLVRWTGDLMGLGCFSLDVKALRLEMVCGLTYHIMHMHIYTNFPPSLSSPTI